jgi:cyclopropane-fatty-acyl-phospholipid synthase
MAHQSTCPSFPKSCRISNAPDSIVLDIEVLRLHYAKTLQAWADRFEAIATKPRRCTTSGSAGCGNSILRGARYVFLYEHHVVWQIQLAKNVYALPNITRDYIAARESELRERESKPAPDLRLAGQ